MMRQHLGYIYYLIDILAVSVAPLVAFVLVHFQLPEGAAAQGITLLTGVNMMLGALIIFAMDIHKSMWRYTSWFDIKRTMAAASLVVVLSYGSLSTVSPIAVASLPTVMVQWLLLIFALCLPRGIVRLLFVEDYSQDYPETDQEIHVLLIGVGLSADLYTQFIKKNAVRNIVIEGVLHEDGLLLGRRVGGLKILGSPEELGDILASLNVHGVRIDMVVVASPFDQLSLKSRQTLSEWEAKGAIEINRFDTMLGSTLPQKQSRRAPAFAAKQAAMHGGFEKKGMAHSPSASRQSSLPRQFNSYQLVKRGIDILGALFLITILAPVIIVVACLIAVDLGKPVLFWQKRVGYLGRSLRLYKFRTMRHSLRNLDVDRASHKSGDESRTTQLTRLLKKFRLDELPQIYHILVGDMSFVGPRPLLDEDQPENGAFRFSVRPGITGWAQVHGGDDLTPEEKLVLDTWYIVRMSLWLDIKIVLKTLAAPAKNEKANHEIIQEAIKDLA